MEIYEKKGTEENQLNSILEEYKERFEIKKFVELMENQKQNNYSLISKNELKDMGKKILNIM